ncbi:single-stranded DNA-binding protein [Ectobacillus ponti]|uniref:Single-stranded DNA-binding protein n=1 Tax=Ectobacillus ponti TaxID=2961894 RepID=A0AA42BPB4_9BACI|nr:single-stranded DNA-binding protein [Ectobacillus ponti]MCP8968935.1 single-stranded DNA-binding protein [Ectobacillus ponti]
MINRVALTGRLTRDAQLAHTSSGRAYTRLTIAVDRVYRGRDGERETDFISCTLWGRTAEAMSQYCQRGRLIAVTGQIRTSRYEKEGKRVYQTDVLIESIAFLDRRRQTEPEPDLQEA